MGAQAVYIDTLLLSQREPKIAPSLIKRVYEIEKMESDNVPGLRRPWRGSGLVDKVRKGLKRCEIFGKLPA